MSSAKSTGPSLVSAGLPSLPQRVWSIWKSRGTSYLWHKTLRRTPGEWLALKRSLLYQNPRTYWTLRGGEDYFREQEDHPTRGDRLAWVADRIAGYQPVSVLEVGCGYGKLLRALLDRGVERVVGVDFSPSQLGRAQQYIGSRENVDLILASGDRLPFASGAFDLVVTSAVILHNPPEIAERMRREVARVGRRWAAHNEDTNSTYNRYGYDTAAWYRAAGYEVAEVGPIPVVPESERACSQFCVANLCRA